MARLRVERNCLVEDDDRLVDLALLDQRARLGNKRLGRRRRRFRSGDIALALPRAQGDEKLLESGGPRVRGIERKRPVVVRYGAIQLSFSLEHGGTTGQ